jgi:p-aminobenzoyl-glutamate transporter AbgT
LRGIQAGLRTGPHSKQSALRVATVVCLVLLALLAVIQVTHVHAFDSDADHCTLCVVMHSVVPLVVMLVTVILFRIGNPAPVFLEDRPAIRYWQPTLFTRPPPADC